MKNLRDLSVSYGALIIAITVIMLSVNIGVGVLADHVSTVELSPEWSPADTDNDYTARICSAGGNELNESINEVRIYQNYMGSSLYTDFECKEKEGWELEFINAYPACIYVAEEEQYYLDSDNQCENFNFSAHSPEPGQCDLEWRFETRDTVDHWQHIYDTTSVDNQTPEITKDIIGAQSGPCPPGAGEECWIKQGPDSKINITVEEQGQCGPSGLDWCEISYTVDGGEKITETYADLDGEDTFNYLLEFGEDSVHDLNVTCKDLADNTMMDVETFRVDNTPPTTDKEFNGPQKIDGNVEWIDGVTTITLDPEDPDPTGESCNIGINETFYTNDVFTEDLKYCEDPEQYCNGEYVPENYPPHIGKGEGDSQIDWKLWNGTPIQKEQESCHVMKYFSTDQLGNVEDVQYNCFFVDKSAPNLEKEHGEPNVFDETTNTTWVTPETDITFNCDDAQPHPSGDEMLYFEVFYDLEGMVTEDYCDIYDGEMVDGECAVDVSEDEFNFNFNEGEDSYHELRYYCEDAVEKKTEKHVQKYRVDSNAPEINKTMLGTEGIDWLGDCPPGEGDVCYVTDNGAGGIHVEVQDPDPTGEGCAVDEVTCEYEVNWVEEDTIVDSGTFGEEGANITFTEDSEHEVTITCEDALGNQISDVETFLVDTKAPTTTKTYGEPAKVEDGYRWITSDTPINLTAEDEKVGVEKFTYRITNLGDEKCPSACQETGEGDWTDAMGESVEFNIPEQSCHLIEYYGVDELGNVETTQSQCVMVDNTAPMGNKTVGEPKIPCELENGEEVQEGECWWVRNHETPITLDCEDQGPHPVEQETVRYKVLFDNESTPDLTENYCNEFGGELTENGWCSAYVGDDPYEFTFMEDSEHELEFYCEDHLGNTEMESDVETFKVDSVAPTTTKTYEGPHYTNNTSQWIDTASTVRLETEDGGDICAVGDSQTFYRYNRVDDRMCAEPEEYCGQNEVRPTMGVENGWERYTEPFAIPEESCHMIEYYSEDALGNKEEVNYQCTYVDKSAPEVQKSLGRPFFIDPECANGGDDNGACTYDLTDYETSASTSGPGSIWTTRNDCGNISQDVNSYELGEEVYINAKNFPEGTYDWSIKGASGGGSCDPNEIVASGQINISESGDLCVTPYTVENDDCGVYKVNVGGKSDNYNVRGEPIPCEDNGECPIWITSDTPIWLEAIDPEPHPSGVREMMYRTSIVDDSYCYHDEEWDCENATGEGEWKTYDESFNIDESSCHLIEAKATDNVDKEGTHKQCVFVENEAPTPNKTVGKPSSYCEGVECDEWEWKVTTMTPITLNCTDTGDHPVDHSTVHWRVWWDKNDEWSEWKSAPQGTEIFLNEECLHELEFYCEDALGQESEHDIEKFKVEGSDFDIDLNRKWNLISVPFVMLDDSIDEAFSDIEDEVKSVWTYDSAADEWYVYTPDGDDTNDNLETMKPGWGYWVLAENDTTLTIGGSLFSQVQTPPTKEITSGWNLVGYFGTDGQDKYAGPVGNGKRSYCELYSLVDTMIGNQRWSSLVTYWEEDNPNQWKYLNNQYRMDPGAGYWLEMDVEDTYTFSTSCGMGDTA